MTPTLTVIIPTPDGIDLNRCLYSILEQRIVDGDEVIIVGDTQSNPLSEMEEFIRRLGAPFRYIAHAAGYHAWGHPQINAGIAAAQGDYLVFIDDDDAFAPDAFTAIRLAVAERDVPCPHLFRFVAFDRRVLWHTREVQEGHLGGHQFVTPNLPGRLGTWTDRYNGDFDFIVSTLALWPQDAVVWREEIISIARPAP